MITQSDIDAFSDGQPRFVKRQDDASNSVILPVVAIEQAFRIWFSLSAATIRLMLPVYVRPR
ncbi:hypothetical protein GCM10007036_19100 [Alsobacter metallidurans]|uniref:Uncharacterized protein n=1 Tax=Alsobacter metallidurans TaxID=340221 RepID=A0A917MHG1_9HYPH|nr:hypothetical protein [Alsobacter metallidurans]GGH17567.1 hypothetical protein GCM10007036_19100 [Alsobacter metallidurans]